MLIDKVSSTINGYRVDHWSKSRAKKNQLNNLRRGTVSTNEHCDVTRDVANLHGDMEVRTLPLSSWPRFFGNFYQNSNKMTVEQVSTALHHPLGIYKSEVKHSLSGSSIHPSMYKSQIGPFLFEAQ